MKHQAIYPPTNSIAVAVDYINLNACRGIRADHVAKEMGYVSQTDFDRSYKAATGRTPGQAILERQIQEARRLLLETQFSIAFIAGSCGFLNQRIFSRAFRNAEGSPPAQFRRQAGGAKPSKRGLA